MTLLRKWGILIAAVVATGLAFFGTQMFRGEIADDGPVTPLPAAYSAGLDAAGRGDWSTAATEFEAALAVAPDAPPLLFALSTAYVESGKHLRGVVYLQAYLEAWPDARNAKAVKARIKSLVAPYRDAARQMAEEAVAQLDGIVDDRARAALSRAMAGRLLDLRPGVFDGYDAFAATHPSRITEATLDYIIARGTGLSAPEVAHIWLAGAIEAEANAASEDVGRAGCDALVSLAAPPAYQPCESFIAQGADRVQACVNEQAGVGALNRTVLRGNRDSFASHLSFYAAARLWASGVDGKTIVGPLIDSYKTRHALGRAQATGGDVSSRDCGSWPGKAQDLNFIHFADGSGMEAWLPPPGERVDFSKAAPAGRGVPVAPPLRTWRAVVGEKVIDVGPERAALSFDDPVFGDLSDAVRVIGRETAETRPERLSTLAWRLGLLVQRLDPP